MYNFDFKLQAIHLTFIYCSKLPSPRNACMCIYVCVCVRVRISVCVHVSLLVCVYASHHVGHVCVVCVCMCDRAKHLQM